MVEKRQTRAEGVGTQAEDAAEDRRRESLLESLPDGLKPPKTIHDELADELLAMAERQVAELRGRFGPKASKPRLEGIEKLFEESVGRAPRISDEMQKLMRGQTAIQKVATLDGSFDRALATAFNAYDKSSVQSGSHVQSAYDDWSMAVRIYKSEQRATGALLWAEIEAVNHPQASRDYDDYDDDTYDPVRTEPHTRYYVRASKIAQALLGYEKTMQQAGSALAAAYGTLMTELYNAADALAVAEATLIASTQAAYSVFWTGVQSAVTQTRP